LATPAINSMPWKSRDEVHHAADRVRTVDRRAAVRQDFDALDHRHRDDVQVDGLADAGTLGGAAPVDQHQRALGAEAAQVDVGERLSRRARLRTEVADRRERHGPHELGHRGGTAGLDLRAVDGRDGQRALGVHALDARAGDLDALPLLRNGKAGRHHGGTAKGEHQPRAEFCSPEHAISLREERKG
jgi:hypothetical protein